MIKEKKVALIILDGWGMTTDEAKSATSVAHTPFIDSLFISGPRCQLYASEEQVGLPQGQVGNSEVGHSTLGTGRVNYQSLVRIQQAISDCSFFAHEALLQAIHTTHQQKKTFHLIGLLSDGGVHSHITHLFAIIDLLCLCNQAFVVHVITDGRDTDPHAGQMYIKQLQQKLIGTKGVIGSIIGRYYAMDRDLRWERIKFAYELYVHGLGEFCSNPEEAIQRRYAAGITDEFIDPICCLTHDTGTITHGDAVLFFNFRSDRARELTSCLSQKAYPEYEMDPLRDVTFLCMTEYDASFTGLTVLFPPLSLANPLGKVLSDVGKTQLRIAETEKYPHVTFFFNAGREEPYPGEERVMIPSPKVATYDLQPEMSTGELTEACITYVERYVPDFICLNYANPDMVGHTGVFEAVVKACETVDTCTERLTKTLIAKGYQIIILADHGNADYMINADGSVNTAHSLALVPCFLVNGPSGVVLHDGSLADVAPTIIELMQVPQPQEMTGKSLLIK